MPLKAFASSSEVEKRIELRKAVQEAPSSSGQSVHDLGSGLAQISGSSMNDLAPLMGQDLSSFSCTQGMGLTGPSLLESGVTRLQGSRTGQGKRRQMGPSGESVDRSLGLAKQWCQVKIQWELLLCQLKVRPRRLQGRDGDTAVEETSRGLRVPADPPPLRPRGPPPSRPRGPLGPNGGSGC